MVKKILAVVLVLCLVGGVAFAQKAQWDNAKKQYTIEPNAKIIIGLDNDVWGNAIVALWKKVHPEAPNAVEYNNFGAAGSMDQVSAVQGDAPDIVMGIDTESARNTQSLLQIDSVLANLAKTHTISKFFDNANTGGIVKFMPIAYDGMAFAWNKTMLEALKMPIADLDPVDGVPDAFDTFEEIFALGKTWQATRPVYKKQKLNVVYPFCIEDVWGAYAQLTVAGWQIFKEGDSTKPGFEKPEFLKGLEFFKAASESMISVEANGTKTPGSALVMSRYQEMLEAQIAPFGLVGTWMDVNAAEKKNKCDYKFGPMPTWKGMRPTPFVKSKGFAVNAFTKYPSTTHELMRILFTKEGMQVMIDNSSYIPALTAKSSIAPNFKKDPNKVEMAGAFAFNYPEPSGNLPKNRFRKGMDGYYNINANLEYRAVWDGEKTPEQAQASLVELFNKWLEANNK